MHFIAHRGLHSYEIGENTYEAIELASKVKLIDGIEIDVRLTSDNKVVVIHDKTIDRTSNGSGNIADMTLRELRKFNYGSNLSPSTINTLDEILNELNSFNLLIIELKDEGTKNKILVDEVLKIINNFPNLNIWLKSFSLDIVNLLKNNSNYPIGILIDKTRTAYLNEDVDFYSISKHVINKSIFKTLSNNGKTLMIWTVDSFNELEDLTKRLGEYLNDAYIISNNPLELQKKNL